MITTISRTQRKENAIVTNHIGMELVKSKYLDYVDQQEANKMFWYMLTVMSIPTLMMIPSIVAMWIMVPNFEYFIGFSMILFFANVSVHIVDMKSRVYIPMFHVTMLLFILIPVITYFISQ